MKQLDDILRQNAAFKTLLNGKETSLLMILTMRHY